MPRFAPWLWAILALNGCARPPETPPWCMADVQSATEKKLSYISADMTDMRWVESCVRRYDRFASEHPGTRVVLRFKGALDVSSGVERDASRSQSLREMALNADKGANLIDYAEIPRAPRDDKLASVSIAFATQ